MAFSCRRMQGRSGGVQCQGRIAVGLLALCSGVLCERPEAGGSALWVDHVTAGRRVSIWTNKAQMEAEAVLPPPPNRTHPWALQTRWDFTANVASPPPGVRFVLIEMGATPFCGTNSCSDTIVLFGLSSLNAAGDVRLRSYKSPAVQQAVKSLHANATVRTPLIHFSQLEQDNVTIVYKFFAGNSSFYGVGGGSTPDGGRIEVRELIAHNLVAPLEIFYTAQGHEETAYETPLVYHHSDITPRRYVSEASPPAWPPQVAPVMPNMFSARVKGFEGNSTTEYGVWHYDWPRNRLRNDYVITEHNRTFNMTQLWLAAEKKFFVFDGTSCSYSEMDVGMLRPDAFEHAMLVDPYSPKSNPGGGRYVGREMMDGQWADHFVWGPPGNQQFNLWQDVESNLPLYDYGPGGGSDGGLAGNHWSDWKIGKLPESVFALNTTNCKKEAVLRHVGRIPRRFIREPKTVSAKVPKLPKAWPDAYRMGYTVNITDHSGALWFRNDSVAAWYSAQLQEAHYTHQVRVPINRSQGGFVCEVHFTAKNDVFEYYPADKKCIKMFSSLPPLSSQWPLQDNNYTQTTFTTDQFYKRHTVDVYEGPAVGGSYYMQDVATQLPVTAHRLLGHSASLGRCVGAQRALRLKSLKSRRLWEKVQLQSTHQPLAQPVCLTTVQEQIRIRSTRQTDWSSSDICAPRCGTQMRARSVICTTIAAPCEDAKAMALKENVF